MKHLIFILFFSFALVACKYDGTDTGNPGYDAASPGSDCNGTTRCLTTPYIKMQVGNICKTLKGCFAEIDEGDCNLQVMQQTGLSAEITLQKDTYKEIDDLYTQKKMKIDANAFGTCFKAIQNLSCDSSIMQNAITLDGGIDYTHVHILLQADSACKDIYSLKE